MNEAFEKILEKLEELQNNLLSQTEGDVSVQVGIINGVMYSMKIVQEVSEEYKGGWISVKDRLPDKADSYLVIGKSGGAKVTKWYMPSEYYPEGHFGGNNTDWVRYWMPRPEPPKERD